MSGWRQRSTDVIRTALKCAGTIQSLHYATMVMRRAYPFGERKGQPYRRWLIEVRLALVDLAKLHGWELPNPPKRNRRRLRDVPGQLMLFGGGGFLNAAHLCLLSRAHDGPSALALRPLRRAPVAGRAATYQEAKQEGRS